MGSSQRFRNMSNLEDLDNFDPFEEWDWDDNNIADPSALMEDEEEWGLDELKAAACLDHQSRSLIEFMKAGYPEYLDGWIHHEVASILETFSREVAAKKGPRQIICLPPRTGKSMLASERFPVWHLGRHPDHEIVIAGYALKVARDRTTEGRRLAEEKNTQAALGSITLRGDVRSKTDWRIEGGGGVLAVGVRGALTGAGAHILIIDDPVKDWMDAYSPTIRDAIWAWFASVAYTRVAPGGGILIIMTRWHEDDLVGRALDRMKGEGWKVANYPAIAIADEKFRKAGEALHPARYPLEVLERMQKNLPPRVWEALYMGMPSTPGGSVWRRGWFRFWSNKRLTQAQIDVGYRSKPGHFDMILLSWDLTFGSKSSRASYVVGQAWGRAGEDLFLLEEVRSRMGFVESKRKVKQMAARYRNPITAIEDKANGPAVLDALRKEVPRLKAVSPDGSKLARAHAAAGMIESGKVFLPDLAEESWVAAYLDEVTAFPEGKHDDRVDTTSQAIRLMTRARVRALFARGR